HSPTNRLTSDVFTAMVVAPAWCPSSPSSTTCFEQTAWITGSSPDVAAAACSGRTKGCAHADVATVHTSSHTITLATCRPALFVNDNATSPVRSIVCKVLPRKQHVGVAELAEVGDARGVQAADQVVAFVLHHAGVEAFGAAVDAYALWVEALVADQRITADRAAQARYGQAAFPAFFHVLRQRRDQWIEQDRARHRGRIGIALVAIEARSHQLQVDADLRRS